MSGWALFWTIVFFSTLVAYAGIALWVTVAGFRDLKKLGRKLHGDAER